MKKDKRDEKPAARPGRKYLLWLPLLAALAVYSNSFQGPFLAGDEEHIIVRNRYLDDWKFLPNILTENLWAGSGENCNFYRPLQTLSYAAINHVRGKTVWPYHLLNVLLQGLCGVLAAYLFAALAPEAGALACGLLACAWTAHPFAVEQIAGPAGTAEPLFLFFTLAALVLFSAKIKKGPLRPTAQLTYCGLFACALLSKESAVVVPALALLIHIVLAKQGRAPKGNYLKTHFAGWLIAGGYVLLRLTRLNFGGTLNFYAEPGPFDNFACRLFTFLSVLGKGFLVIFAPYGLHPERSLSFYCGPAHAAVLIPLAGLAALVYWAISRWKKGETAPVLGLGWFFISYLPTSNLVAAINAVMWDHWFYAPAIGLGFPLLVLAKKPKFFYAFCAAAVIALGAASFSRNHFWKSQREYSSYILSHEPGSVKHWNNLAMSFPDSETDQAIAAYKKAISLGDIYPQTHHNLALAYKRKGRVDLAEAELNAALKMNPDFYHSHLALAEILYARRDFKGALAHLRRAKEIFPYYPGLDQSIAALERAR